MKSVEKILIYTKLGSLAFWDAYLKDNRRAKAYLHSQDLPSFSNGIVKVESK